MGAEALGARGFDGVVDSAVCSSPVAQEAAFIYFYKRVQKPKTHFGVRIFSFYLRNK